MGKYCQRCGAELLDTSWGKRFCRNCGKLIENQDKDEWHSPDDDSTEAVSYVG